MSARLFWQHVALLALFGAMVLVDRALRRNRERRWQQVLEDEVRAVRRSWGIVAQDYERTRSRVAELEQRVTDLEEECHAARPR